MSNKELIRQGFQVKNGIVVAGNGIGLKNMFQGGQQWLEAHVGIVNNLNVFPVPDGDTGTNMWLTMRAALREVEEAPDHTVGVIAAFAARGALLGARGNSGVILSQFLQGLARGFENQRAFTTQNFARAAKLGAEQAYQSVINPVEGTILTVARAISEAAQQSAKSGRDVLAQLVAVLAAARLAQANTPALLPVLREAGVTDAGGQGLVYILEGGLRFINNGLVDLSPVSPVLPVRLKPTVSEAYGYDVQFLIQGERLDVPEIRAYINSIGRSTLVVGDERLVKVHVHTPNPEAPLSYGASQGIVSDVVVENLDEQTRAFVGQVETKQTTIAVIAVVPGEGLAKICRSLGASQVLFGGQTKNPSVQELLAAIEQVKATTVLVLPNNKNVIPAAQQAQSLSPKKVVVLPAKTVPQGIAALLSFNHQTDLKTNVQRMLEATQQVRTLEVARAARASSLNGFNIKTGDVIGLLDNKLVSAGQDEDEVSLAALLPLEVQAYDLMTIYFGQDRLLKQAQALAGKIRARYAHLQIEIHPGGQPHYQYIISLE
ncbi:MAG: DAK2 domain-containing protein [Anaerolineae bacterium]|nr:DAK2 domain-containing protein [Anaerolineae bacterium]